MFTFALYHLSIIVAACIVATLTGVDFVFYCVSFSREMKYSAGIANKRLSYYDGMLKLVYKGGDRYHSMAVNRSTEIVFMCDYNAGDGSPYFKAETDHTYTIEWYTALACLPQTVECSVTDEERGLYYDLTR